ncbi:MAG: hypothetical protein ACLR17_07555 [Enterobacteriaceae bacterium]
MAYCTERILRDRPYSGKELVGMQTGERASTEDAKGWGRTRMSRRKGFLTDVITDVVSRFWKLGIVPPAKGEEISVGWSICWRRARQRRLPIWTSSQMLL